MRRKRRTDAERTRAALYRPVSTGMQTYGQSLEVQRKQGLVLARTRGWEIVGDYADAGVSGAVWGKQRPGLQALLGDVRKGLIDHVIVASLDRLGRTTAGVLDVVAVLRKHGVVLTSCREGFDTRTPVGMCMVTLCAALAELERETGLQRTDAGRQERGRTDGEKGGNLPLGYQRIDGRIALEPAEAEVVRCIFALKRARRNMSQIAVILNRDEVPTGKGGAKWHPSSVREVLLREAIYRGGQRGASEMCWPVILPPPGGKRDGDT